MRDLTTAPISSTGSFVEEHCRSHHTRGKCTPCDRGTFTAHANGLDSCNVCATCSESESAATGTFLDLETPDLAVTRPGTFPKEVINVEPKYFPTMMFAA